MADALYNAPKWAGKHLCMWSLAAFVHLAQPSTRMKDGSQDWCISREVPSAIRWLPLEPSQANGNDAKKMQLVRRDLPTDTQCLQATSSNPNSNMEMDNIRWHHCPDTKIRKYYQSTTH